MDEPEFVVVGRQVDLPFRPRGLFAGYWAFGVDDFAVLIGPDVRAQLLEAARRADPRETGGVVVGRTLRDADGPYTLVTGVVCAPPEVGDHGHLRLPPELTTMLKEEAARRFPSCDAVGWWHSHMIPSSYSQTDRDNQRIWSDPRHVGLLVFARPDGAEWARVYVGPDSRLAYRLAAPAPVPGDEPAAGPTRLGEPTGEFGRVIFRPRLPRRPGPPGARPGPGRPAGGTRGARTPGAATSIRPLPVLAVVLILMVAGFASVYAQLAALIEDRIPAGRTPRLSWSCQPLGGSRYRCSAASESAGDLEWRVNGRPAGTGSTVILSAAGHPAVVELYLHDGERVARLGGMSVSVDAGDDPSADGAPTVQPTPRTRTG